ncbi:hypothetical protein [Curtobacterium sp. MCBD17_021]|uniref:hypothetical protein n=1 Tax=Curtobacterium sp. MCBD17_021 TaxID=2175665 RepID=UPI000DA78B8D|nr:hypothetical protein [Curtobacterium sp. MCBD17_021]PZE66936.1 hypothetical protein DEI83_06400 [Curtobacterium sp. MCBD17_021]
MTLNSYELAAEMRDAAEHNFQAGNHQTAGTQALIAMMRLQFAAAEPVRIEITPGAFDQAEAGRIAASEARLQLRKPTVTSAAIPTVQGVYQAANGTPWFRSAAETTKPWLDIYSAHGTDRWFTDEEAAKHAPFTRMEAVA